MPELRTSSTPAGSSRPRRPTPWTTSSVGASCSTRAPSACTAVTVASVSALGPNPRTRTGPSQTAPINAARCDTDLSPFTEISPASGPVPSTSQSAVTHGASSCPGSSRVAIAP